LGEAHAQGGAYPLMGIHIGPITVPWRMQSRQRPTADVPSPNILLLPQSRTDAVLHRLLDRLGLHVGYDLRRPEGGAELRRYAVHTGHGGEDGYLDDHTGRLARIYGITGDTLILVRPDGYVGTIVTADWAAGFGTAIESFTAT
jgi:hypothetical protein